jgi:hypothetical protein
MAVRVLVGGSLMHGGGINAQAFAADLDRHRIDYVAADAGSSDPGPHYLGSGESMTHRAGLKQALEGMLVAVRQRNIPLLIGSAGIAGRKEQVDLFRDLILEIADERKLAPFKLATVYSDVTKERIKKALSEGRVTPLGPVPPLTPEEVDGTSHVVAMMGAEPLIEALRDGADVVVAGRSSDSALFAAFALWKGAAVAPTWHMSKTIECGALCSERGPGVSTGIWAEVDSEKFVVGTTNPAVDARCTPLSVAAHTLYENSSPYYLYEPSGMIDTRNSNYRQLDEWSVEVTGTEFKEAEQYTVKLEGASLAGYRTLTIAGVDDPILIGQLDEYLETCRKKTLASLQSQGFDADKVTIHFRRYGSGEAVTDGLAVAIIADIIAPDQETANAGANMIHGSLLHGTYKGRIGTAGNMAFPFSPCDLPAGPVYKFSVWHLMAIDDPVEPFTIQMHEVNRVAELVGANRG